MGEQAPAQTQAQPLHDTIAAGGGRDDDCDGGGSFSEDLIVTVELGNVTPQNPNPSSKLPFRPRKIRKISPASSSDRKSSLSDVAGDHKPTAAAAKTEKNRIVPYRASLPPIIAARSLSCEGEIDIALRHLRHSDPHLARLIDVYQPPSFDTFQTPFLALTKSILYQQLAYKAGTSIYTRFVSLCGGEDGVLPDTVLALTPPQLRQIGVSGRKASYLHDLSRKYRNGILSDSSIVEMDDKSLFTMLTMVNGIGSWSVHMFMIFSLHRPDVLPIGDLGIRKGVQLLYGLEELPRPSQLDQLCDNWRPYRSVASWYLWRLAEGKGAPSSRVAVSTAATLQHQQHQEQQQQQQSEPQLLDPINSILNLGACAWGQ